MKRLIIWNRLRSSMTPISRFANCRTGVSVSSRSPSRWRSDPKLLLLDEPAAGVPSSESHLILDVISKLDPNITVLIIEHDMDLVFRFASRIIVLVAGEVLTEGSPEEISADERVRSVYLGERREDRHHG